MRTKANRRCRYSRLKPMRRGRNDRIERTRRISSCRSALHSMPSCHLTTSSATSTRTKTSQAADRNQNPCAFVEVAEKLPEEVKTELGSKYLPQQSLELEERFPRSNSSMVRRPSFQTSFSRTTSGRSQTRSRATFRTCSRTRQSWVVINQDAYHAIMSIVFAIPYDMNDPGTNGSALAKALWPQMEKFRPRRLALDIRGDVYTIVYSLRIKNLALASGICPGHRPARDEAARCAWSATDPNDVERLVGKEEVQDKVREFARQRDLQGRLLRRTRPSRRPRRRARSGRCGRWSKPLRPKP